MGVSLLVHGYKSRSFLKPKVVP